MLETARHAYVFGLSGMGCGDCLLTKLMPDILTIGLLTFRTILLFCPVVGGGIMLLLLVTAFP